MINSGELLTQMSQSPRDRLCDDRKRLIGRTPRRFGVLENHSMQDGDHNQPMRRVMLRVGAALAGVAAATASLLIPTSYLTDKARFSAVYLQAPHFHFSDSVGVYATLFVAMSFCVANAYLLLQYAVAGLRSEGNSRLNVATHRFFKGLAVGSAAVIILAVTSQYVLLGIATVCLRKSPEGMTVHWSPQMWVATRDSLAFLTLELVHLFRLSTGNIIGRPALDAAGLPPDVVLRSACCWHAFVRDMAHGDARR